MKTDTLLDLELKNRILIDLVKKQSKVISMMFIDKDDYKETLELYEEIEQLKQQLK